MQPQQVVAMLNHPSQPWGVSLNVAWQIKPRDTAETAADALDLILASGATSGT
jgi:hypothetical protein